LKILSALFGQIGPRAEIVPPFYCDYGCHIFAEDNVYMNFGCVILDVCEVRIGRNVLFAPYVQVYAAHHPTDPAIRRGGHELGSPVTVGDDVWIGGGVILCPGVTIGSNTTIGAGSVVTRDIPANVVAAGNPCRVIRPVDGEGSGDMMRV
jgi:maltose O-acetyltransferase